MRTSKKTISIILVVIMVILSLPVAGAVPATRPPYWGDVQREGNNEITISDVVKVADFANNQTTLTLEEQCFGDVDLDGAITYRGDGLENADLSELGDAQIIAAYTVGKISSFPAETLAQYSFVAPTKTVYAVGEPLDTAGMSVIVSNKNDANISYTLTENIEVTGYNANATGTQELSAKLRGLSFPFTVTVTDEQEQPRPPYWGDVTGDSIVSSSDVRKLALSIDNENPLTLEQQCFGDVDLDGAITSRGADIENPTTDELGDVQLIANYIIGAISTLPAEDLAQYCFVAPTKTAYAVGEPLDTAGMSVVITNKNNNNISYTLTENIEVAGYDANTVGTQELTATFRGLSFPFAVTVGNSGEPYAVYNAADKSLTFCVGTKTNAGVVRAGGIVVSGDTYYSDFMSSQYAYNDVHAPWYDHRSEIETVDFADILAPESTTWWFHGFQSLKEIRNIRRLDTSNVINMSGMFYQCTDLQELDVSGFNTSNVTEMYGMFFNCCSLQTLDVSGFDTSNVTSFSNMFVSCSGLTSLDVSGFDTSSAVNLTGMFGSCNALTALDVSNFDTSNVTSLFGMFSDCSSLTTLYVSNFETSKVQYMGYMFRFCKGLTTLDLSGFDTSSATSMDFMFQGCSGLTSLDVSSFDTSNVTNMELMFCSCTRLTELDLSSFNTSQVTNMSHMFDGCSNLIDLDLSGFDTSNVTNMYYMLSGCDALSKLTLGDNFHFIGDTVLSPVPTAVPNTGKWMRENGDGTAYTSSQLEDSYDGATMAGTYVWDNLEKIEAVAATCTTAGNEAYYTSTVSGKFFSDEKAENEIVKDSWIIPAKGHTEVIDKAVAPTCLESGLTAGKHCSECNMVLVAQQTVPALGHAWGDWTKLNDDKHQRVCANDNSHTEDELHAWDDGVVTKEATYYEEGSKLYTCTACGATKTVPIKFGLNAIFYDFAQNGGASASQTTAFVAEGSVIDLTPTAEKSEWTFVGWNTDPNATTALSSLTMGSNDVFLYAIYKKTLTATFVDYSGTTKTETTKTVDIYNNANSGTVAAPMQNVYSTGWTTIGWTTETAADASATTSFTIDSDTTYYGLYQRTLTLSYNANGGTSTPSNQIGTQYINSFDIGATKDPTFTLAAAISKTGFIFNGWTKANSSGTIFNAGSSLSIAENTVMYAAWSQITHSVVYNYSKNGGTTATKTSDIVAEGEAIDLSPTATKEDWTFVGWNTDADATTGLTSLVMDTQDVTLYAIYRKVYNLNTMTYSFGNSHQGFGYATDYIIPSNSYCLIYGNNTLSNMLYGQAKKAKDYYGITWQGNCFGMSTTTGMFNSDVVGADIHDYNNSATRVSALQVSDVNSKMKDVTLTRFIESMQVSQFYNFIQDDYSNNANKITELCRLISEATMTGKFPIIALFGPEGGHAVIGYAVEKINETESRIKIYDCNYPNTDRFITLSTDTAGNYTDWQYQIGEKYDPWSSSREGCKMSYVPYEHYKAVWDYRGNAKSLYQEMKKEGYNKDGDILSVNSESFEVRDVDGHLICKVEDGTFTSYDNQVHELLLADIDYVDGYMLEVPTNYYEIINKDENTSKLEVGMVNVDFGATVSTQADSLSVAVDDSFDLSSIMVNTAPGETYEMNLLSSLETGYKEVSLTGTGDGTTVELSYIQGQLSYSIQNSTGVSLIVDGEDQNINQPEPHVHKYISTITKQPTCTEEGVRTYTCEAGDYTYTESISALGHTEPDSNGNCTRCRTHLVDVIDPNACPQCGQVHTGFFGAIIGFFHKLIYRLTHLFG